MSNTLRRAIFAGLTLAVFTPVVFGDCEEWGDRLRSRGHKFWSMSHVSHCSECQRYRCKCKDDCRDWSSDRDSDFSCDHWRERLVDHGHRPWSWDHRSHCSECRRYWDRCH